jgi:nucleoside-diphosphate-sugar epimerase
MKKVLVTGALGFIPSNLCEGLLNKGFFVIGVDNFLTGRFENIERFKEHPNFMFVRGDANNYDTLYKIFYSFHPDLIFHYAACVGVQRTLENPLWVLDDIKGFEHILNLSKDFSVKRVFFSSSSEVYGEPVEFPQNEQTTPLNSKLPYAVVKNVGEVYLKTFQREYGIDYTIFRFFNTFGPRQSPDFVVSKFINQALKGENITIYGDGSQTRTFCYVDDNIEATICAIENPAAINEVFNIGSSQEVSVLELGNKIIEITNSSSKIVHLPALEEGDMTRRKPNNEKMVLSLLGGRSLVSLEDGLKRTIQYFCDRSQEDAINTAIASLKP